MENLSETPVDIPQFTWRYITRDLNIRCENVKTDDEECNVCVAAAWGNSLITQAEFLTLWLQS